MTILHHHHFSQPLATSLTGKLATVTSIAESITTNIPVLVRRATCGPKDNSPECEKPVHDNSLAIGLGVAIPLFFVIVSLTILHFRHIKKLKKEEEASKDIDIDNEYYDPMELKGIQHQSSSYTSNNPGEKTVVNSSTTSLNPNNLMVLDNPFNQFQYNLPALSSSQKSLNNYNPYDKSAYPPSGTIYEHPKYPPSVYTRSSSPVSDVTTFHYNNSSFSQSQRDFHQTNSNMNKGPPKFQNSDMNLSNTSKVSSTLSIVSSHTPTVESFDAQSLGLTTKMEHASIRTISSSGSEDDEEFENFERKTPKRIITDDYELHNDRNIQKLDQSNKDFEPVSDVNTNSLNHDTSSKTITSGINFKTNGISSDIIQSETGSQFSSTNDGQDNDNTATELTERFASENSKQEQSLKEFSKKIKTVDTANQELATTPKIMKQHAENLPEKVEQPDVEPKQTYQKHTINSFQDEHDENVSSRNEIGIATEPVGVHERKPMPEFLAQKNANKTLPREEQQTQSAQYQTEPYSSFSQDSVSRENNEHFHQSDEQQTNTQEYVTSNYTLNSSSPNITNNSYNNYHSQLKPKPIRKTSNHPLQNVQSVESIHAELQSELQYSPTIRNTGNGSYFENNSHSNASSFYSGAPASMFSVSSPRVNSPKNNKPVQPLPELKALPTPHKLDDLGSTIEFVSQKRNPSNSKPSSPSLPAYNPVTSSLSSVSFEERSELPSPSQLRQSVVMFTSNDFSVPKKFGNQSRSRSSSLRSEDGNFHAARQRPPSELVPDVESQMKKLRPQMNMSMRG